MSAVVTAAEARNSLKARLAVCEEKITGLARHSDDPHLAFALRAKTAEAEAIKLQLQDLKPVKQ